MRELTIFRAKTTRRGRGRTIGTNLVCSNVFYLSLLKTVDLKGFSYFGKAVTPSATPSQLNLAGRPHRVYCPDLVALARWSFSNLQLSLDVVSHELAHSHGAKHLPYKRDSRLARLRRTPPHLRRVPAGFDINYPHPEALLGIKAYNSHAHEIFLPGELILPTEMPPGERIENLVPDTADIMATFS